MIGGASWTWWIGFHVGVVVLLLVDVLLHRKPRDTAHSHRLAWIWTAVLAVLAAAFAGWIAMEEGRVLALQFVAGYTIEMSLSIDNLFVFLVLFQGFGLSEERQHVALLWGISGAIVMRAVFIFAGVALLHRFEWITYIFGALLLFAAWRLVRGGSPHAAVPRWIRRIHTPEGSLLPIILAVEATDLVFAIDSIPAVLAISRDPFVVYTSNIAAILGLRSLYFALASLLDRFRYLHYGLGALLAFVAFKMLVAPWLEVPITYSLAIMGAILAICAVASVMAGSREPGTRRSKDQERADPPSKH
jgi:tellurite resistance protein TerC